MKLRNRNQRYDVVGFLTAYCITLLNNDVATTRQWRGDDAEKPVVGDGHERRRARRFK